MEHRETNKPVQEPKEPRMNLAGWIVIGGTILMAVLIMTFWIDWTGFSIRSLLGLLGDLLFYVVGVLPVCLLPPWLVYIFLVDRFMGYSGYMARLAKSLRTDIKPITRIALVAWLLGFVYLQATFFQPAQRILFLKMAVVSGLVPNSLLILWIIVSKLFFRDGKRR